MEDCECGCDEGSLSFRMAIYLSQYDSQYAQEEEEEGDSFEQLLILWGLVLVSCGSKTPHSSMTCDGKQGKVPVHVPEHNYDQHLVLLEESQELYELDMIP